MNSTLQQTMSYYNNRKLNKKTKKKKKKKKKIQAKSPQNFSKVFFFLGSAAATSVKLSYIAVNQAGTAYSIQYFSVPLG